MVNALVYIQVKFVEEIFSRKENDIHVMKTNKIVVY